jgi:hypothetical protein
VIYSWFESAAERLSPTIFNSDQLRALESGLPKKPCHDLRKDKTPLVDINKHTNRYTINSSGNIFYEFINDQTLLGLIKQVSGAKRIRPIQIGVLTKLPLAPMTPWHRDRDHLPVSTNVYTAWIPLTNVSPECSLVYAEGTALVDPILSQHSANNPLSKILEAYGKPISTGRMLIAGDVEIHDGHVWHYAPVNSGAEPRHALAIAYVPDGCRIDLNPQGFDSLLGLTIRLSVLANNFPSLTDGDLIDSSFNPAV